MPKGIEVTYENEAGEETTHTLPSKYEVCGTCGGEGKHVNRAIDGNGITSSEWDELCANDEDFAEQYMGGMYDVVCEECKGLRVVEEIDEEAVECDPKHKEAYAAYIEQRRFDYECRRTYEAERRAGA